MCTRLDFALGAAALAASIVACKSEAEVHRRLIPAAEREYVVVAWNDLGMHCLNPTYEEAVILPPYNNVWAQVIRRSSEPEVVVEGVSLTYSIVNNTYSYGKTDALGGDFSQFWDNAEALFGVADLEHDTGLNLVTPDRHNGLSGELVVFDDHFEANGIPVVPVDDDGEWSPYQVGHIVVRDESGRELASTRFTIPTSDEIDCQNCHDKGGEASEDLDGGGDDNVFLNILAIHDRNADTTLVDDRPVLCASCHASPALGQLERLEGADTFLSEAMHGAHASRGTTCYDCHPGATTQCSRSLAHRGDSGDGNCTTCHGTMQDVADSIASGNRVPWVNEPECSQCHEGVAEVDTGGTLYRHARGHGDLYCAVCHGSPHAMVPTSETSDNAQAEALQTVAKSLGSCGVCHEKSRGEGAREFAETHGGSRGRVSACRVCHTSVNGETDEWPHRFEWSAR